MHSAGRAHHPRGRKPDARGRRPGTLLIRRLARCASAVLAVASTVAIASGALLPSSASATGTPLLCDQSTVYGIDSSGSLQGINVITGATTAVATMPNSTNALGVTDGGMHAYAFSSGTGVNILDDYVASTGAVQPITGVDSGAAAIRGAVNPSNGFFYYAVNTTVSSGTTTTYLGAYDPATGTRYRQVGAIRVASSGSGGDMAFSRTGVLYFLTGNLIYRVDDTVPATSGTTVLGTTLIATIAGVSSSPGIAFASNGYLYASSGATLKKIDPASGTVAATITIPSGFTANDLAGCNNPASLSGSVAAPDRVNDTDQWTVTLAGGTTWSAASKTATTTGTATGVQSAVAGPVLAVGGNTYTATQTMASGSPGDYVTTWSCSASGSVLASGSGGTATVTAPTSSSTNGADIDCRFTNTPKTAVVTWTIALGAARGSDDDQFALAVHRRTATGTTDASVTTTGSGATLGSSSTGATTVVAARPSVLTAAMATGSTLAFAQYGMTVACTDANGLQSGLPTGAAFAGSIAITPVAGAAISCALTAAPRPAALVASVALGATRYADGDQFTVAVQDGNGFALGSASAATTGGTGSTVTGGTGTSGAVVAAAGSAVTIVQTASAHTGKYARALTCTDASGYAVGLPSGAAFSGTRTITAPAGANISCVVTVQPTPAALSVAISSPAVLAVGAPADYPVTVSNDGGLAATATTALRLPQGVAYQSVAGTGWSCTATGTVAAGQLVTCAGPSVTAGGQSGYLLRVVPGADTGGARVEVPVRVDPTGGAPGDPSACTTTTSGCAVAASRLIAAGVALSVTVTGPAALVRGVPTQYVIAVANTGTGAAGSATVLNRLPEGVRFVDAIGASCAAVGRLVTCTVPGPIPAGGALGVVLHVVPDQISGTDSMVNRASVDTDGGTTPVSPVAGCSGAACDSTTGVVHTPALTLSVAAQSGSTARLVAGDVVRYAYTVTNSGPTALEGIALSDGTVCPATALAPGEAMTCVSAERVVTQDDVDAGRFLRSASASAVITDCVGGDCATASNTASATMLTKAVATLSLTLVAHLSDTNGNGRADAGERIRFTGVVTNTGTVAVSGLEVHGSLVDLVCPVSTLAPGASTTCTGEVVVRSSSIVGGVVTNTALAKGHGAVAGAVASRYRSSALAAGPLPVALASTGLDLTTPLGFAGGLLGLALAGVVLLRRRAVRNRRR